MWKTFYRWLKTKELNIVYLGPPLAGKHANLRHLQALALQEFGVKSSTTNELILEGSQLLPLLGMDSAPVGMQPIEFRIQTIPISTYRDPVRDDLLRSMDAAVMVFDSQRGRMDSNAAINWNLKSWMINLNRDMSAIPQVIQYNKRDFPRLETIEVLEQRLNPQQLPYVEASASKGIGVTETLRILVEKLVPSTVTSQAR
ncbi:MAG TPA: hypothetical protein PLS70_19000 [Acidobacteriota bacterium]|nr:hypothetical protein [Acidobacteriota bacterium]